MDEIVHQKRIDHGEGRCVGDFATLFEQLDHVDAIASIDGGLQKLAHAIADARRRAAIRQ